jgi:hypothetical protein
MLCVPDIYPTIIGTTAYKRAASPITAAPAMPIPVFIGAATPDDEAVAEALEVIEAADAVAE